jgi:flagellar hook-associated protein 3 FlgL
MRITTSIIRDNALATIRKNAEQMGVAQQRVSTGLRLTQASDDPSATSSTMNARSSLRALDQYRKGVDEATMRESAEEAVLNQLGDVLSRVKTIGIAQVGGTSDATTRSASKLEVEELMRHVVSLANTQVSGTYLFGGEQSDVKPFDVVNGGPVVDFSTTTPTGNPRVEISAQQWVNNNHNGTTVFGGTTSGVLADIRDMASALDLNDPVAIANVLKRLDGSIDHAQDMVVESGVRANHLQMTSTNLDAVETHLTKLKSDLEEVDVEKAVTDLVSRQTAYQAAMLATSKVMGLTLADYLR